MNKFLTICFVVCSLFSGTLFAQTCNTSLDDSLGPSGNIYQDGDIVEYVVTLGLSSPNDCDVNNIRVYFFPPDITPNNANICEATNGILVFDGGPALLQYGDPDIVIDSSVDANLAYVVDENDADASGFIYARICTKFDAITSIGKLPNTDTKSAINKVVAPDFMVDKSCVDPNGTLIGEDVEFLITITNTGDVALDFNDTGTELDANEPIHLEPNEIFQKIVAKPSIGECNDDLIVSNSIEVQAYYEGLPILTKSDDVNCPVLCPPSFTVEKICLTNPITTEPNAIFEIIITNTGYVPLTFQIDDDAAGIVDMNVGPIAPDANYIMLIEIPAECNEGAVTNRVVVQAYYNGSPVLDPMPDEAECPCGREGCTPGFWKNHTACWCSSYTTTQKLNTVFTFPASMNTLGNKTLLQALSFRGGSTVNAKARILLRAAVSALLNACDEDINYALSEATIIADVNAALASKNKTQILSLASELDYYNNLGCPIDAHCNPIEENGY